MCRTGCPTQDHESWGACCRAANLRIGWVESGMDANKEKDWQSELELYRSARSQGIQPATTRRADIEKAMEVSEWTGKPYDASRGDKASKIPDKRTAAKAVEVGLL